MLLLLLLLLLILLFIYLFIYFKFPSTGCSSLFFFLLFVIEGGTIQTLLEDIERLESLSVLLDKESPGLKNWRHFARKFGVSLDECNNLKPEALSPTKTLMEHLVQVQPKLTVKTLIEALKKIGRRDVVLALTKFFLGNV